MPDPLLLRVLGAASLSAGEPGESTPIFGSGKPLALITYLALSPQRSATREHLTDLLWADADPERARRNLRQTVFLIRSVLGETALTGSGATLTLSAPLRIDRDDFLGCIERGELLAAAEHYGGPFFPAFAAPGGAEFEHWADLERQRLHASFLRALEASVREALGQQRRRDAIALARRLRDAAPEREAGWRALIETLITAGDWFQAAAESDACETMLRDQERTAEPATLASLRAARQAPPLAAASTQIVAEMIGREAEFATVITHWERATQGHLSHVHVTGVAGVGKTRLLRDAAARIAAVGGRVVFLRANQSERELPSALAGDLARALVSLPGATAIAPATAGLLLHLDPSLSSRFPAARAAAPGDDGQRLRIMALAELLAAVAYEHPIALVCDDLHWADALSRQALDGLVSRCSASRVLVLTSSRPGSDAGPPGRADETLTLRPLTANQVGLLMESIAHIPDGLRASGFLTALHTASDGSPLLVLETLQLAVDSGWLTRNGDAWHATDAAELMASLRAGSAVERRLDALEPAARRILLELAVAGGPVDDQAIEATARRTADGATATLHALERSGFAARREAGAWEIAHDVIGERLLARSSREDLRGAHAALGHALAESATRADHWRAAGRHLARTADHGALGETFRRYVKARRRDGDRRSAAQLARDVLGDGAAPGEVSQLVRTLPLRLRVGRTTALASSAAIGLAALAAGYAWLTTPVRLELRQSPRFASDAAERRPFIAEALDRRGRVASGAGDSVAATIIDEGGSFRLRGPMRIPLQSGRAVFDGLQIVREGPGLTLGTVSLRFSYRGLHTASQRIVVGGWASTLRLAAGTLNDQPVTPDVPVLTVRPSERIRGVVHLRFTTDVPGAAILLVAAPAWGDRRTNFVTLTALPPQAADDSISVPLDLPGPDRPGRHFLILAFAAETEGRFVASATNWVLGTPRWFDGNDLADIGREQADSMNRQGGFLNPTLFVLDDDPVKVALDAGRPVPVVAASRRRVHRVSQRLAATALEILVR